MSKPVCVVVVGQTPPPVNGQSLMIDSFLRGSYPGMRLVHVPMDFSRSTSEIGNFGLRKLWVLARVLLGIVSARFRTGATVLYYPPAGPQMVPFLRDVVLLVPTRLLFRRTAFHFHAAGLAEIYPRLPVPLRLLFWMAYRKPDLALFTTRATSGEAEFLGAGRLAIAPCGIADSASDPALFTSGPLASGAGAAARQRILFAGILCEGKGLMVLLEACARLLQSGADFDVECMGAFESPEFRQAVEQRIEESGLGGRVAFPGVLGGREKAESFRRAAVFCFPSHYAAESFGVVLIEAMCFSLPIVATRWRGIPEVTGEDGGALLVAPQDAGQLAEALADVLASPELRARMGAMNRQRYLDRFRVEQYRASISEALMSL